MRSAGGVRLRWRGVSVVRVRIVWMGERLGGGVKGLRGLGGETRGCAGVEE